MPWYPDWLVALDECSKSNDGVRPWGGGIVRPQNARDIIEQLATLKRENERLRKLVPDVSDVPDAPDVTSGVPREIRPKR